MDAISTSPSPLRNKKLQKYIIANNRIRAKEVRLIEKEGAEPVVVSLKEALIKAEQAGLDLIQITDKVDPPVCKIMEYGKYAYQIDKKEKKQKQHGTTLKSIRLSFNISPHDIETRAKAAVKFLDKGHKLQIDMRLRGREKALHDHAKEKMKEFLRVLGEQVETKIEREPKRTPRGFNIVIAKK